MTTISIINKCVKLIKHNDMVVHASKDGKFEPETFAYIDEHFPNYGNFVDVGAYTGIYSIYLALTKNAECYAFEPNENCYERLRDNIVLNGLELDYKSFHTYNVALSDKSGTALIHTNPNTLISSGGTLERGVDDYSKSLSQSITTQRFDDTRSSVPTIDMIKIDVEGHELSVLEGMKHTIERDSPIIIVECWSDERAVDVLEQIADTHLYMCIDKFDKDNYIFEPISIKDFV